MVEETKSEQTIETAPKEKEHSQPKFFMGKDEKIECVVTDYYNKETGILEFCVPGENQTDVERFNVVKHIFYFKGRPREELRYYTRKKKES